MQTLRFALPLAALLLATPALAQPASPAAAPSAAAAPSDAAAKHERGKAGMGAKMGPKQPHDHMRDKQGMMTWPNGKPMTAAEMQRMHEQCAAMMAKAGPPAKK
jgi:hypothetical protein